MDHPDGFGSDPVAVKRQAIAEALRGVDLLRDPAGRRMCIEFSEAEIGEAILGPDGSSPGSPSDDDDLLGLVDQLLVRELAMWIFVYTITDIYKSSNITDPVLAVVKTHLAEPVLSREQRIALHDLCHRMVGLDVPRLFRTSIDNVGYQMRSDPANLCSVLNELEELPARDRDGLHPIAAFVEYLAREQPPESASILHAWVDNFVGTRTPHLNAVHSIRTADNVPAEPSTPDPSPDETRYCAIYINEDGIGGDLWTVSIYLQEGSLPAVPLLPPDDSPYTEAEIRDRIGEALNSRQLAGIRPADIRIEFYLPVPLINLPVDRWRIGAAGIVLGLQYQVVVRCLTRHRNYRSAHAHLLDKWSASDTVQFAIPPGIPGNGYLHLGGTGWLAEEAADQRRDQVFVSLSAKAGPICLLLADAPVPDHSIALVLAFAAGIPILMWSRRQQTDIVAGLSGRLPGGTPLRLRDLPRRVLGFRAQAASRNAGPADLANHLTLVYDDADRIPDAEGQSPMF